MRYYTTPQATIVSCSGFAGSGKTTFANVLVKNFGFTRLSYAGALKEEVRAFLEKHDVAYHNDHLYGDANDKDEILKIRLDWSKPWSFEEMWFWTWFKVDCVHITPRLLMQLWGTEFRRTHFGSEYWGDKLQEHIAPGGKYVVDDTRFKNEYVRLKRLGATMVLIDRYDAPKYNHPSETDLIHITDWTYVVRNRGSLDEFLSYAEKFGCLMRG